MIGKRHLQQKLLIWVLGFGLTAGFAGVSQVAGQSGFPVGTPAAGVELTPHPVPPTAVPVSDAVDDPPGLFNDEGLEHMEELAASLSSHPNWLTPEILQALDEQSLRPDEIFSGFPQYFSKDGIFYVIKLDKIGPLWAEFDPEDPYFVYLSLEVYDAMGTDSVLGFQNGVEMIFSDEDFKRHPAVGLTVRKVAPGEMVAKSASVVELGNPIELGEVRLEVNRGELPSAHTAAFFATKSGCAHEVALSSCVGGAIPVCSPGSESYFVLDKLWIKTEHDGFLSGNPEIELYQLSFEELENPPDHPTTALIFDGRNFQDAAGRSRYLPDVNNTNRWYDVGGVVLFPLNLGGGWVADLVEDDKVQGELRARGSTQLTVKIFGANGNVSYQTVTLEELGFLENFIRVFINFFAGAGDDFFQKPLGITNFFGCTSGLGSGSPPILTLDTNEWKIQGHFSCINPTCAPLGVNINGPSLIDKGQSDTWTVSVASGIPPFTYHWTKKTGTTVVNLGSGTSVTTGGSSSFTLTCDVTDSAGQSATDKISVKVFSEPQACPTCPPL